MDAGEEVALLERAWLDRFGEPLPMRTDPDLIRAVLAQEAGPHPSSCPAKAA
jgi:hypothetical protein